MEISNLAAVPFELIILLAFGYFGYRVFSTGLSQHHKTYDVYLQTMLFGIPPVMLMRMTEWQQSGWDLLKIVLFGLITTIFVSLIARWIFPIIQRIPQCLKITNENYHSSAYVAFMEGRGTDIRLVELVLKDNTTLISNISLVPHDVHHSKLEMDENGNIAMYITNINYADSTALEIPKDNISHSFYGSALTYIPNDQIARITLYRK